MSIEASVGQAGRDTLVRTAQELGISPEALEAAEKNYWIEEKERLEREEFIRHRKRNFGQHLLSYFGVCAFLVFLNLRDWHGSFWAAYPLLGWGIFGILSDAISTFSKGPNFELEFQKWRETRKTNESDG